MNKNHSNSPAFCLCRLDSSLVWFRLRTLFNYGSCDLVLDDRPGSHMACVRDGFQPMTAVKQTSFLFFLLSLLLFLSFFASIYSLYSIFVPSSELFVFTLTSLCAAVIIHSAFILLLSLSALICLRACVMWSALTVFSWRQTESPEAASWPVS